MWNSNSYCCLQCYFRNNQFGRGTQEDSYELLNTLLSGVFDEVALVYVCTWIIILKLYILCCLTKNWKNLLWWLTNFYILGDREYWTYRLADLIYHLVCYVHWNECVKEKKTRLWQKGNFFKKEKLIVRKHEDTYR